MDKALDWAQDLIKLAMADPLLLNAATLIGGLVAVGTIIGGLFAAMRWLTGKLHQPRSPDPKLSAPPAADRSLTRYSARAVELLGRDAALARLQGFLQADAGFAWMQIAGLGGQGKSRLGYELTLWAQDQGWQAGLLESADLAAFGEERWADWQPARPHLILLDYVIGREAAIKPLLQTLAARADGLRRPVRLLLLERQRWDRGGLAVVDRSANRSANQSTNQSTGPDLAPTLGTDGRAEWFLKLAERYDGNDPVLDATRFEDGLLELERLEPENLIAIVRRIAGLEGAELGLADRTIAEQLRRIDGAGRPLYAYFLGQALAAGSDPSARPGWQRDDLLSATLDRDRGSRWQQALGEAAPCLGDDSPAERIAVIATIAGGLDCAAAARDQLIPHADAATRRQALVLTDGPLSSGAAGPSQQIPPLQPDLLGEWFVLSACAEGLPAAEVLDLAWRHAPEQTAAFLQRLSQDFPDHLITDDLLGREPPDAAAAEALAQVAATIIRNLYRAQRPFPESIIVAVAAAAQAGDGRAMNNLGLCYGSGEGVERDLEEAVRWYRRGAEAGDGTAMTNLGYYCMHGWGVERDLEEAVRWYRRGAEAGNGSAMSELGFCYQHGKGVELDLEQAMRWHRRAAEAGGEAATASLRALIAAERSGDWAHRLAEGLDRVAWVDPPPIPGDWKGLAGAEAEVLLAPLKRHLELAECRGDLEGLYVQRLRRARLGFYRDSVLLLDLQLRRQGKVTPVLLSALVTPTWTSLLNGGSPVIDAANRYWLALDSDQVAEAYLRFLCTFVRGEEGPYQLIDDIADLPMDDAERAALSAEVRQSIRPPRRLDGDPDTEGLRRFEACVLHGRDLFWATFKVWPTGMIDMERDHQLAADLPVRLRHYDGIFRTPLSDAAGT